MADSILELPKEVDVKVGTWSKWKLYGDSLEDFGAILRVKISNVARGMSISFLDSLFLIWNESPFVVPASKGADTMNLKEADKDRAKIG